MIGTRIGNFELKRLIGSGGMATVYYAEHITISDEARVYKVLQPHLTESPIAERFFNEARAAAKIKHRNIARARDFGRVGNSMYIEMDWFEGETLSNAIALLPAPMQPSRVIAILSGVAAGIHAAHQIGIIHRDLKPENILVAKVDGTSDVAKVLDFGVAKLRGELAAGTATATGVMIGTPAYASPEQLEANASITPAVDVWALGVIAYVLTTGYLPFQTEPTRDAFFNLSPFQIYNRLVTQSPIDPRTRNPNISPAMAQVILRAIERDPARRFDSARAFAIALAESVGPEGLKILRKYAPDLLDDGNMLETMRSPGSGRGSTSPARYTFDRKLGEGGMAEVYIGTATGAEGFSKPVAIKRVLSTFSALPQFGEMFVAEARLVSQLRHENIVAVHDFDRDTVGRLFLVMEYVDGRDLNALVKSGPLPPSVAIYVAIEILTGLGHAHGQLVLHRDISPHNVLLSWTGAVKLSDFGIAKALDASGSGQSAVVKGKPGYMSPEQIRADVLDARSDLYAIGIVLWELVTGRKLFTGGVKETFEMILYRDPPPPSAVRPVPRDLEAVIMKLLARDPQSRYANAEQVIHDLAACANAPRQGRGELVRLLCERFPDAAPRSRSSAEQMRPVEQMRSEPTSGATANLRSPVPMLAPLVPSLPATVPNPANISTLSGSASQSSPQTLAPSGKRTRWPIIAAGGTLAVASGLIGVVLARGPKATPSTNTASVASTQDAAVRQDPKVASTMPDVATVTTTPSDAGAADNRADAAIATNVERVDAGAVAITTRPEADTERTRVRAPVATATGEAEITASPWAEVIVDGKRLGQTPIRTTLPVGRHKLTMKHSTKQKTITITVTKDKPVVVDEDTGTW